MSTFTGGIKNGCFGGLVPPRIHLLHRSAPVRFLQACHEVALAGLPNQGRVPPQNPKVYSRNAAEQGAPARMVALVACLRDALLSSDVPENDRLTLLEPIKLHASGWKLCLEQQLSYASLDDAAGDDCDYVQNLSPLPCRFSE
ncbi:hypothetical protein MRX96_001971 [Rhipicephalus microplus]